MPDKTASSYLRISSTGETISFTGITSVRLTHALQTETEIHEEDAENVINGARTLPSTITLSLIESDAERASGWSARVAETLERIRKSRLLCTLVTPLHSYSAVLLTEFTLIRDDTSPFGFIGTLTFTEYFAPKVIPKENDNASTATQSGSAAPPRTASTSAGNGSSTPAPTPTPAPVSSGIGSASPLKPILLRAGIALEAI